MSSALELKGIVQTFHQGETPLEVLRGADLKVDAGEIVALVGPSGAGKSTLLQIAGLLEKPASGDVIVKGESADGLGDDRRTEIRRQELGFVYQYHHLLAEFSARENIVIPQMIASTDKKAACARADELLATMGLTDRASHRPAASSNASPSPAPWRINRMCCWPMSRPAISIRLPLMASLACSLIWSSNPASAL